MKLTGQVLDRRGEPIANAKVYVSDQAGKPQKTAGSQIGAVANIDGIYSINIPIMTSGILMGFPAVKYLSTSAMGYETRTQSTVEVIKDRGIIQLLASDSYQEIEETVVVGRPKPAVTLEIPEPKFKASKVVIGSIIGLVILALAIVLIKKSLEK